MSTDCLLSDCGLGDQAKRATLERWRDTFQGEFKIDALGKKQLSDKFRGERRKLESLFGDSSDGGGEWQFAKLALARRSVRVREAIGKLRALAGEGKLGTEVIDLAASFSHMHINRLIRSSQRAHELVLYDFLFQIYDGRIARKTRIESVLHAQSRS